MSRMPGATWKPISTNYRPGGIGQVVGCVIHHMVSSEASAFAHFNTPGSGASAHFGVCYDGTIYQYVDTDNAAFHACQANYEGQIGIENESPSGDSPDVWAPLRPAQVEACARILAWAHQAHGVPLRVADPGDRRGLGYHSMVPGPCAAAWGQTGCPGDAIVAQRPEIVQRAAGAAPEPEDDDEMAKSTLIGSIENPEYGIYLCDGIAIHKVARPQQVDELVDKGMVTNKRGANGQVELVLLTAEAWTAYIDYDDWFRKAT